MSRGIAKAGVELRCDMDFVGRRMKQGLERLLAELKKKPIPPVTPAFCQVVPTAIDRRLAPDRLGVVEFYGYDLDAQSSPVLRHPGLKAPVQRVTGLRGRGVPGSRLRWSRAAEVQHGHSLQWRPLGYSGGLQADDPPGGHGGGLWRERDALGQRQRLRQHL